MMETTLPNQQSFRPRRKDEEAAFLALLDVGFAREPGRELRKDFPVALAPANVEGQFVLEKDGILIAAAALVRRNWRTSEGILPVAVMGCFTTAPKYRGRGFSAILQRGMIEYCRNRGDELAVLWTGDPEYYISRGFRPMGREWHMSLEGMPELPMPSGLREIQAEDAAGLMELYRRHALRVDRKAADLSLHLEASCRGWMIEDSRGPSAYILLGKGEDFPGYIHEFGGDPPLVHALWSYARRWGARHMLLPDGSQLYFRGAASGLFLREQAALYGVKLQPVSHSGAGSPDIRLAAWGCDSA